jgi:outer membrane protein OmpA-like peptidoglycan-associated protein
MMRPITVSILLAGLVVLMACATAAGPDGDIEHARAAISQAQSDPAIAKYAPVTLEGARNFLATAENLARQKGGDEAIAHYAYLATQMALIAGQKAREQSALARVQSAELERRELLAPPPAADLPVDYRATNRGLVLTLAADTFDTARAIVKPSTRRGLDALAKFLRDNPGRRVQIEAFTDAQGSSVYNLELSQDRADAVAMAVIDRGVDAARVRAVGWGEKYPVASNESEAARQRNRRVEIIVSKGDAAVPVRVVNAP